MKGRGSKRKGLACGVVLCGVFALAACGDEGWQRLTVKATAYNAIPPQTKKGHVGLTAWGHRLQVDDKVIAVSRDLIDDGLGNGARVRIEGLEGVWIVRDKMNKRWRQKIDIFMGDDIEAAREWGVREVTIHWRPAPD